MFLAKVFNLYRSLYGKIKNHYYRCGHSNALTDTGPLEYLPVLRRVDWALLTYTIIRITRTISSTYVCVFYFFQKNA